MDTRQTSKEIHCIWWAVRLKKEQISILTMSNLFFYIKSCNSFIIDYKLLLYYKKDYVKIVTNKSINIMVWNLKHIFCKRVSFSHQRKRIAKLFFFLINKAWDSKRSVLKFRAGRGPAETKRKNIQRMFLRRGPEGSPTIGTNDVSVRTFKVRMERDMKSIREIWLIFLRLKFL